MDEREALRLVEELVPGAGDDAAVVGETAVAVDMLHAEADVPSGVTDFTLGWRTVAVALSDIAAVGARATAALAVYSPNALAAGPLERFVEGATAAAESVGASYVGGDLDVTAEVTTVGVGLGRTDRAVGRAGASPGDAVVVTGTLGRGALAVRRFDRGDHAVANELFRFVPRVDAGVRLRRDATAMIDSSDGLARSVHLLAEASGSGIDLDGDAVPIDDRLAAVAGDGETVRDLGLFWGEDFELVATVPPSALGALADDLAVPLTRVGEVTEGGVSIDGRPLPDRGYDHA